MDELQDEARAVWLGHLATFFDAIGRHNTQILGMQAAAESNKAAEGDGYRIVNAVMEIRRLCLDEEQALAGALQGPMDQNGELYVMGFRALVLKVATRADRCIAAFGTPEATATSKDLAQSVKDLIDVRGDMARLIP
jgi:hypothetical protein